MKTHEAIKDRKTHKIVRASTVLAGALLINSTLSYNNFSNQGNIDNNKAFVALAVRNESGQKLNAQGYPKLDELEDDSEFPTPKVETKDGLTYIEGILIANKTFDLPKDYNPGLSDTASDAFAKLVDGAKKDGLNIYLSSGFRSYSDQEYIYNSYKENDKERDPDTYSARAGYSEHQTGLAIDVNEISDKFIGTPEAEWIEKHCWEYGFILRYPKDGQDKTGYKYESWHIRYIGKAKAKAVTESGVTLEEYLGITSKYGAEKKIPEQEVDLEEGGSNKNDRNKVDSEYSDWADSESWVVHKDDWRHGIDSEDTNKKIQVDYELGMADGKYAITLKNGNYYWYHQTATICDCEYCGSWSKLQWGNSRGINSETDGHNAYHRLGEDGASVYSLAIILSNLKNSSITPRDVLKELGGSFTTNNVCETSDKFFGGSGSREMKVKEVIDFENTQKLEVATLNANPSKEDFQDFIDKQLDKGGLVWYRYGCETTGPNRWPEVPILDNWVAIYNHDGDGYYILNQLNPKYDNMNKAISIDDLYNYRKDLSTDISLAGFYNPNPPKVWVEGTGGSSFKGGGNWISDASSLKKSTKSVELGGGVNLYNGLPWEPNSETYVCYTDQMAIGALEYCISLGGETPKHRDGSEVTTEWITSMDRFINDVSVNNNNDLRNLGYSAVFYNDGGGQVAKIDGVVCVGVALPPLCYDPNYNENFGNYDASSNKNYWAMQACAPGEKYGYSTKKMAVIMREKESGNVYYLPSTTVSAKGHTFPGGLCQTGISVTGKAKLNSDGSVASFGGLSFAVSTSGYTSSNQTGLTGDKLNAVCNQAIYAGGFTIFDCMNNSAEFWNMPKSVASALNGKYRCIGVVVWGDS